METPGSQDDLDSNVQATHNSDLLNTTMDNDIIDTEDVHSICQSKVVLLGEVGAGKTSLLNALRFRESRLAPLGPEGRTIGIEVHLVKWRKDLTCCFYDFAGHRTYHFCHQLFLSQPAIYLITVDIATYQAHDFKHQVAYWYRLLNDRLVAPFIFVIGTHVDQCKNKETLTDKISDIEKQLKHLESEEVRDLRKHVENLKKTLMRRSNGNFDALRDFHPRTLRRPCEQLANILKNRPKWHKKVVCVSSKTLCGIERMMGLVNDIVHKYHEYFPTKTVPATWHKLEAVLAEEKNNIPFMPISAYYKMAQQMNIGEEECMEALKYLHSVGVVIDDSNIQSHKTNKQQKYVITNPNLLLAVFGLAYNHNFYQDQIRYIWKDPAILKLPRSDFLDVIRKTLKEKGLLGESLLKCFWESLGITDSMFAVMLAIMEKFDLCCRVTIVKQTHQNFYLFPYLLAEQQPPEVSTFWPSIPEKNVDQFEIEIAFSSNELPLGLFEVAAVRMNALVEQRINWKLGMVALCNDGQEILKLECHLPPEGTAGLTITTRVHVNRHEHGRKLLLSSAELLYRLLSCSYPSVVTYWYTKCSHCIQLNHKHSNRSIDRFPLDNILKLPPDAKLVCHNCGEGEEVQVHQVFPSSEVTGESNTVYNST